MRTETVQLTPSARLTAYLSDRCVMPPSRDALLVIPGGGYFNISTEREGEAICLYFLSRGVSCFMLEYSIKENAKFPLPLQEAALAMKHIREHAHEYYVNLRRVFAIGFSAGGHLTAALGSCFDDPAVTSLPGMTPDLARPTGTILCYPVITGGVHRHDDSFKRICGSPEPTEEELNRWSIEKRVTSKSSPTFLMHTFADDLVPVQNSLLLASAMAEAAVPFEMHIFPEGEHGLALANAVTANRPDRIIPEVAIWAELAFNWMSRFQEDAQ